MRKKYRLKVSVLVFVYVLSLGAIISSLYLVGKVLKSSIYNDENLSYVYKNLINNSIPVVGDVSNKIIKPYTNENVVQVKGFYEMNADAKAQEQAIIYYENTYMPNTGILYGANEAFDILCVMDGTVEEIIPDEILGNIVVIKHTNNLITRYSSLNEVSIMVGDTLKTGDVIGTAGENKVDSTYTNMLLFEVENCGVYTNPETIYGIESSELF